MNQFKIFEQESFRHGVTTRLGGISNPPYDTMNTSFYGQDDKQHVMTNIKRSLDTLGMTAKTIVATAQVHSTTILSINKAFDFSALRRFDTSHTALDGYDLYIAEKTDGLITNRTDVILMTFYADCVPIILYDPITGTAATVHSGWRGTKNRIGQIAIESMCSQFGARVQAIRAGIGQSAGKCCYEVDFPVIEAFEKNYPKTLLSGAVFPKDYGKYHLDLKWLNSQLLQMNGILPQHIEVNSDCTICGIEKYHSHRRAAGGARGTMSALIQCGL
ncbi:MAG: purine-nucleoside/S-methyl-5-thioadenosine phosphorylase / adenosine deaminase [Clostridiales bacterium]|nr:purine-nucleoside/S-methyl-5-thioadenosine phosphorylase / adenosine deaminase [Clostridiales bacterium]MDN5299446.1 purine-nucleoside/S-methyl-5-thioadenosine phosphorylase / adenosine deaminase [Clostridiales bacterium]